MAGMADSGERDDSGDLQAQDRIILLYQAMCAMIRAMLNAARIEDWDDLARLEAECAAQVKALQRDEPLATLSAGQKTQKAALIAQMLSDDGETRQLVAARMTQLSNQMNSTSTERKLSRAYGA